MAALTDREIQLVTRVDTPSGVTFTPISETGRLTTTAGTYATVTSWTVTAGALGILAEVSVTSDTPGVTQYRLTIGGVVKWTDRLFQTHLTVPFPDTPLPAASVVLLEAQSDGSTSIIADGSISGEERS